MNRWNALGIGLLIAWIVLGLAAFMPPEERHHHRSQGDEIVLVPQMNQDPVESVLEPALDLYGFLVAPTLASGHSDFPKYCGEGHAAKPNHYFYVWNKWKANGRHYHSGDMNHVIGSDYRFTFVCGYKRANGTWHHYRPWPQGWP